MKKNLNEKKFTYCVVEYSDSRKINTYIMRRMIRPSRYNISVSRDMYTCFIVVFVFCFCYLQYSPRVISSVFLVSELALQFSITALSIAASHHVFSRVDSSKSLSCLFSRFTTASLTCDRQIFSVRGRHVHCLRAISVSSCEISGSYSLLS